MKALFCAKVGNFRLNLILIVLADCCGLKLNYGSPGGGYAFHNIQIFNLRFKEI